MRYAKLIPPTAAGAEPRPWIIGDDSKRGPGSAFIISGWSSMEQIVQGIEYIDASFTRNIAYGNVNVPITIVVEMEFADESECFLFLMRLPLDCPRYGALELGVLGTGGAKIYYPSATLNSATPFDVTVTSAKIRYEIQAGPPG